MNGWSALDRFLRTDPRDVGCEQAMEMLHVYAGLVASGERAEQRYPGIGAPAGVRPVRGGLRGAAGRAPRRSAVAGICAARGWPDRGTACRSPWTDRSRPPSPARIMPVPGRLEFAGATCWLVWVESGWAAASFLPFVRVRRYPPRSVPSCPDTPQGGSCGIFTGPGWDRGETTGSYEPVVSPSPPAFRLADGADCAVRCRFPFCLLCRALAGTRPGGVGSCPWGSSGYLCITGSSRHRPGCQGWRLSTTRPRHLPHGRSLRTPLRR
jgi:hypothetical protein